MSKLDSLFIVSGDMGADASPDITGLIGQYAHGNEPSHHILYMYNYIGQPWKGAEKIRYVLKNLYHDDFDGLSGNEDVGQMSAWYILSALGFYQVEPAGGKYIIGSPIFDDAVINVGNGKTFRIITHNNSDKNMYIQSAKLNGKPYTRSYIDYKDIVRGGTLEFTMGDKPSQFGVKRQIGLNSEASMGDFYNIVSQFKIEGKIKDILPIGNGLINETLRVSTIAADTPDYILQRINNNVFPDVNLLQHNIEAVTGHIRNKLKELGEEDVNRKCLHFIESVGGKTYYQDANGNYWRMSIFIPDSFTRKK